MPKTCPQCRLPFKAVGLGEQFRVYCSFQCKWRAYYYRHPDRSKNRREKSRKSNASFVDSFKTLCVDCGNTDSRVLDFHHLRDKIKAVAVMRTAGWSKKRILAEIKKCIVLCANCHRIRHWKEYNE
jgi:hypothetical protein